MLNKGVNAAKSAFLGVALPMIVGAFIVALIGALIGKKLTA